MATPDELLDVFILVAKIRQTASALETTLCLCLRAKSVSADYKLTRDSKIH